MENSISYGIYNLNLIPFLLVIFAIASKMMWEQGTAENELPVKKQVQMYLHVR